MDRWYHSLDSLKGLAILGVILVHTRPFIEQSGFTWYIGLFLVTIASYAVPVFFLTSGFLLRKKINSTDHSKRYVEKYLKNIARYYTFATIFYFAVNVFLLGISSLNQFEWVAELVIFNFSDFGGLGNIIYLGDAVTYHLWFLTALFFSTIIVSMGYNHLSDRLILVLSSILHFTGIMSLGYGFPLPVPQADALFFGLFYTAIGFYIGGNEEIKNLLSNRILILTFLVSIPLSFSERMFILIKGFESQVYTLSYHFFIIPLSISLFLYAVSNPEAGKGSRLQFYGKNSLWMYIIHPVFVVIAAGVPALLELFTSYNITNSALWSLLWAPTVLVLTVAFLRLVKTMKNNSKN